MRLFIIFAFLSFFGGNGIAQITRADAPAGKYRQIYAVMTDSLVEEDIRAQIKRIGTDDPQHLFFSFLLFRCLEEKGEFASADSLYDYVRGGFARAGYDRMAFETELYQGMSLNGRKEYERAYPILDDCRRRMGDRFPDTEMKVLYELAYNNLYTEKLSVAAMYCCRAIERIEAVKDSALLVEAYNLAGVIGKRQFRFDSSIRYYRKALQINSRCGTKRLSLILLNNIASLYTELERHENALETGRGMFDYFPEGELTREELIMKCVMMNSLGVFLNNTGAFGAAADTVRMALRQGGDRLPGGLLLAMHTVLAKSFAGLQMADSAAHYFRLALTREEACRNPQDLANLNYLYGTFLAREKKQYRQAREYLEKANAFYAGHPRAIGVETQVELASLESEAFGNYRQGYDYLRQAYDTYREKTRQDYLNRLSGFETEYKTLEKELEIRDLILKREQEQQIYRSRLVAGLALLLTGALALISLLLLLRKRDAEFRMRELSMQQLMHEKMHASELVLNELTAKMRDRYLAGLEDSNRRLAAELHDGVCNRMLVLQMQLPKAVPAATGIEINQIRQELRALSHTLSTPEFRTVSLPLILEDYVAKIREMQRFCIDLFLDEKVRHTDYDQRMQLEIYRIVQEGIGNVIRHADPNNAYITLSESDGRVELVIEDDGVGFDAGYRPDGIGMRLMRERATCLGGTFDVVGRPGMGTVVHVTFPVEG